MAKKNRRSTSIPFNKYHYYEASVQAVDSDIDFINENFKKIRGERPLSLREDFCGTGKLICEWVKQGPKHRAVGVDLDSEPIEYGLAKHHAPLSSKQKDRVAYQKRNVLAAGDIKADVIVAFNFSYWIFKKRRELILYFSEVRKALTPGGVFFIDLFGGPESQTLCEDVTKHGKFSYFWQCQKFNPISHDCLFAIHFKRQGEKKRLNVFTYDWRYWTLPELREILREAGFKCSKVYWEEEGRDGTGNGVYFETEEGTDDSAWVSYIAAYS